MNFQFSLARLLAALTCFALAFAALNLPGREWEIDGGPYGGWMMVYPGRDVAIVLGCVACSVLVHVPRAIAATAIAAVGTVTSLRIMDWLWFDYTVRTFGGTSPYYLPVGYVLLCLTAVVAVFTRGIPPGKTKKMLLSRAAASVVALSIVFAIVSLLPGVR